MRKRMGRFIILLGIILCLVVGDILFVNREINYGVFLNANGSNVQNIKGYSKVVIDAEYFTKKQIKEIKKSGSLVYSYINVGSLEKFRDYYNKYSFLKLGKYENWKEEIWVDVSNNKWKKHIEELSYNYISKGVDGFFIDNCDVYYNYPQEKIYKGLCEILKKLKETGKYVIINGGDVFVKKYIKQNGQVQDILSGVNQECVYSTIDFNNNKLGISKDADRKYYISYLKDVEKYGGHIYILEYTKNSRLKWKIYKQCKKNNWNYYISDSIELD